MELTNFEQKALAHINEVMRDYGDGYSDVTPDEISDELGVSIHVAKGVIGSLVKKNLIMTDYVQESGLHILYSFSWNEK